MIDMSFKVICRSTKTVDLNLYYQVPDCVISLVYKESYEILSYLILCYKRQYRMVDADGYTLLTSVDLKEMYGNNYYRGLEELLEFGYIESKVIYNEFGKPHRFSKELGIASSYRITKLVKKSWTKRGF